MARLDRGELVGQVALACHRQRRASDAGEQGEQRAQGSGGGADPDHRRRPSRAGG